MAAVLAVRCVRCGPCRLLCWGGVPCGGKHIIIDRRVVASGRGLQLLILLTASFGLLSTASASAPVVFLGSALSFCGLSRMI